NRRELRRQDRLVPGGRNERHGREVVDLLRPAGAQRTHERPLIEHVGLDQLHTVADAGEVLVGGLAPDDAEDLVALRKQELREQRPVLAADPCDHRALRHAARSSTIRATSPPGPATSRPRRPKNGPSGTSFGKWRLYAWFQFGCSRTTSRETSRTGAERSSSSSRPASYQRSKK